MNKSLAIGIVVVLVVLGVLAYLTLNKGGSPHLLK